MGLEGERIFAFGVADRPAGGRRSANCRQLVAEPLIHGPRSRRFGDHMRHLQVAQRLQTIPAVRPRLRRATPLDLWYVALRSLSTRPKAGRALQCYIQ